MDFLARLDLVTGDEAHPALVEKVAAARQSFGEMMLSDVNAPGALGVMFDLVRTLNAAIDAGEVGKSDVAAIREAFDHFDRVLGIIALRRAEEAAPPVPVDEIERLIEERRDARRKRDFGARGSDPPGPRRARHPARRFAGGYALEAEIIAAC